MTQFDGVEYSTCQLIPPAHYHAKASLAGDALQAAMQGAYYFARHSGRMLLCQPYGWNNIGAGRYAQRAVQTYNANYWRIAEGFIDVPPYATHIVALISFAMLSQDEHSVLHRIAVGSDTGQPSSTPVAPSDETMVAAFQKYKGDPRSQLKTRPDPSVFFANPKIASCEIELDTEYTETSNAGVELVVEAKFTKEEASSNFSCYRPGFIWVGYECRG